MTELFFVVALVLIGLMAFAAGIWWEGGTL